MNKFDIINIYIIRKFDHEGRIKNMFDKFIYFLFNRETAVDDPEQVQFFHDVEAIIEKDVVRTDRSHPYFKGDDNPHLKVMK